MNSISSLEHPALPAELVFPDGIEHEFDFIAVFVDCFCVKLTVFQEDFVDNEIGVLRMLVLAAETIPFRLVDTYSISTCRHF